MEARVKSILDSVIDDQEAYVLKELSSLSAQAIVSLDDGNISSIVPLAGLSAISQALVVGLDDAYRMGASHAIRRGVGDTVPVNIANNSSSQQLEVVNTFNKTTQNQLIASIAAGASMDSSGSDSNSGLLDAAAIAFFVKSTFNKLRENRSSLVVSTAVYGAYNKGAFDAAAQKALKSNRPLYKTWNSMKDESVREAHRDLDGKRVLVSSPFFVDGYKLMYPKDPLAPPNLTINCRCFLTFAF